MKKRFAILLAVIAIFMLVPTQAARADFVEDTDDTFTIIWLADTQDMAYHSYDHALQKMGKWIIDQKDLLDIRYVVQTGDMVDNGASAWQWALFDEMFLQFKGKIPYIGAAGNHEIKKNGYLEYLMRPEVRMIPRSNAYMAGKSSFCTLEVHGVKLILVAIGNNAEKESADWVHKVLSQHSDYSAIILVHDNLYQGARYSVIGKWMRDNIIKVNPNIRLVLSGNALNTSAITEEFDDNGDGTAERKVVEMMYNYQAYGEDCGQLRALQFNTREHSITVTTYSPVTEKYYKEYWFGNTATFTIDNAF